FVTGEIVQSSEGWLDAAGLRPQEYWLQRGQRRMEVARFDWDERRLALEGGARADLADQAQDLMSLPFHLAMTAREGEGEFALGVTNGRKFNEFTFRQLGREGIEVGGRSLAALRLQGSRPGEGTLDIWLDLDGSGLPVRIRTTDRKGEVMELRLLGTESPAGNPS
ncbi:MAG: DUF3108 domain-containing protein, partial [Gallionellaceae bacterium]|nr:DUF3108 domain-containing protein [Gallionellaceae bacterium]